MKKVLIFLSMALLVSCGREQTRPEPVKKDNSQTVVKRSKESAPNWIIMQKKSDRYMYFTGIGSGTNELKAVRDKALEDAMSQIVSYIGFRVSSKMQRTTEYKDTDEASTFRQTLKESVEGKGNAKISVNMDDFYYEQTADGNYTMYVLLKLPKKWAESERARLNKLAAEQRMQAKDDLQKSDKLISSGHWSSAMDKLLTATFLSEQAAENSDLYDQCKLKLRSLFADLTFSLKNNPKFAYIEGGSDPIKVEVRSAGSSAPLFGVLTTAGVEKSLARVVSESGYSSDKKGIVEYRVDSISERGIKDIQVLVTFSLKKMQKIKSFDPDFYKELRKLQISMALPVNLKVVPRDKALPTAVVIVSVVRLRKRLVKPMFRPDIYDRIAGFLANNGYNILSVEVPKEVLIEARESKALRDTVMAYLKKKYPSIKRMFFGIEIIIPTGVTPGTQGKGRSVQVNSVLSLIDVNSSKLEKSVNLMGRGWGNSLQQGVKVAERKAYQKLLEKLGVFK